MTHDINKLSKRKAKETISTATETRADIYQRGTDQIVAAIEAGAGCWKMPWHNESGIRPVNAATKKAYRGVNVIALWIAADRQGYPSQEWATYQQWQEAGAQVRKGERSQFVVFWKRNDKDEENDAPEGEEGNKARMFARGYNVFNAAQVDGYTPLALPEPKPQPPQNREAEAFFTATCADIRTGGNRAYYKPSMDYIQMPPFEAFPDTTDYYSVLGHECVHWTSAKHRLDRDLTGRFGTEAYAAEELIAELGAAFLCADLGLANTPRPDHAAYVANWLQVLKNDNRAIFTAASKAQQAADYLHDLQTDPQHKAVPGLSP